MAYTSITEIVAPSKAAVGSTVPVTVKVKNIDGYWDHVIQLIVVFYDIYGEMDSFIKAAVVIRSLETHSFSGSFIMPNCDTIIDAFTYYPVGKEWIFDARKSKDVSLAEVPEPYTGAISKKELEYDESRASIPAHDVPQGERGLVHIWGRNDMSTNQKMGIYWIVRDSDGVVVEEYSRWETFWTRPGKEQEFIGDRFNLDKAGLYDIRCGLLMNPDNPLYVHTYYGDLCTVAAVAPPPPAVWSIIGGDISLTISISPVVVGWQVIGDDISLTIHLAPTVRVWQIIGDDISLTVGIPPVIPPAPPDEEEEEEEVEKEFPWLEAALIGGGVALMIASAKPKKIKT